VRKHLALAFLFVGLLLLNWRLSRPAADSAPPKNTKAATAPVAPAERVLAEPASPAPAVSAAPAATGPLPQGIVAIWHGRFDSPLKTLAPSLSPPRDFTPPVLVSVPVGEGKRVRVRLNRFDVTGADAGVFTGVTDDRPGGTVVLSYVGDSQAGVVYLPEEGRSYVISGGDDGVVRVTETDLANAPGCPPAPLIPPVAQL
jgi:hypothetical protein